MSVLFVFIDGLGIGKAFSENPLMDTSLQFFSETGGGNGLYSGSPEREETDFLYKKVDANLGIKGLPQSGTGQVSLFSGVNASKIIGRHFGPYPHSQVKYLLEEQSIFQKTIRLNKKPHFLNAYPEIFFRSSERKNRWSSTTYMVRAAGLRLNRLKDVQNGTALTAEVNQIAWRNKLRLDVPEITPETAAGRALSQMKLYDLLLFEYYLTDKAGHAQDKKMAKEVLTVVDRFLLHIMQYRRTEDTVVICSDHGNIEDLSVKTHTRNPVPLIVSGKNKPFRNAQSILDVTPGIIEILKEM